MSRLPFLTLIIGTLSSCALSACTLAPSTPQPTPLVTDIDPRVASYTIATTGAGLSRNTEEEYYLGFGDHHYDYVSPETPGSVRDWQAQQPVVNIFEGNAQKLPGGNLHLYGSDTVTLPSHLGGPNLQGQTTRTWEIWLDTSLDD